MSQQTPTPNPTSRQGWFIMIWIGMILLVGTFLVGIYAIIEKYDILISAITFTLAVVAIPIGILQVKPDAFKYVWRTRKTGRLVIGITILFFSLTMNVYKFAQIHASVSDPIQRASSTKDVPPTTISTITTVGSSEATTTSSCTDTEYVADFYNLAHPYPEAKEWFSYLKPKWTEAPVPISGDIIVINANKQGFGPEGYVGIIHQPVIATGTKKWLLTIRSTGFPGGTFVNDAHCSNVVDFTCEISAGYNDGVAFFHKV